MTTTLHWNLAVDAEITEPGVYDIPADRYHADPVKGGSLSSTGARRLLPPSCPALYHHQQTSPPTPSDEMTFGSAVHKLALGRGADIIEVEADSWRTNAAKQAKKTAHADGQIPLLTHDLTQAKRVAAALRQHPVAAALLNPDAGRTEQTLVWQDAQTGVWCRAMLDYLPTPVPGKRLIAVDVKTCPSAANEKISRAVWDLGYFIQAAFYLDGINALGLGERPAMTFIFQERTAPFLVNVGELDQLALEAGRHYVRQARLIYAECKATGRWPSYSDEIELIPLPPWGQNTYFQETGL